MLDSVKEEITQNTFNANPIDININMRLLRMHNKPGPGTFQMRNNLDQNIVKNTHKVFSVDVQNGAACIKARNFQKVRKQGLEAIHLVMHKLHTARLHRIEGVTRVIKEFAAQTYRRQRCTQLMRHIRDESLLQRR